MTTDDRSPQEKANEAIGWWVVIDAQVRRVASLPEEQRLVWPAKGSTLAPLITHFGWPSLGAADQAGSRMVDRATIRRPR